MTGLPKTRTWGAVALALALGCGAAGAQTPIPPAPKDFAASAAQSDQYETMAAQVALVEAQDPRVRSFAEAMLKDHARTAEALRRAATASGLPPPAPGMSSDEAALLSGLQGVRGAAFDKRYAGQQVVAHAQAVAVADSFATAGADPALREAARSALPMMRDHLKKAQELRDAVGGR